MANKEPFAGFPHEEKEMAALGQKGLPIGPVLPVVGKVSEQDIEAQREKNEEENK